MNLLNKSENKKTSILTVSRQENIPDLSRGSQEIKPGDIVRVYQKIKEVLLGEGAKTAKKAVGKKVKELQNKERIQIFEGIVIACHRKKGPSANITVRKISDGIGVECIFPIHSPNIQKIEVVKHTKVRRAKLYYLRKRIGKAAQVSEVKLETTGSITEDKKEAETDEKSENLEIE